MKASIITRQKAIHMKKSFIFLCLAFIIHIDVWGQYTDVSIERANSLSSMADFYSTAHNYTKAIELEKQSLEIKKQLFGSRSTEYAVTASSLAGYYYLSGDYNNAVKYEEESISIYTELEGKDNVEYPELLSVLVEYHHKNGTYQKMIEYQKVITDIYAKLYGKDTQHYALSLAVLSNIYSEIGDYSNAIEAAEKGVAVYRQSNETKELNYMLVLNNLADLYYARGFLKGEDKSRSIKMKEELVDIAAELYGKDNIEYAKWLSNYSLYYLNANGNDIKVQNIIQRVQEIYEKEKDRKNSDCSGLLGNLSNCLSFIGDNKSAINYSMELLKQLDEYDSTYSTCLDDIAKYYANMKDYPKAVEYVSLSLRSIRKMINNTNDNQDVYRHYLYWTATNLLDKLVNYVSRNPTDSAVSILYDEAINTRTLRVNKGLGKWCSWKDIQSHLEENEIAIEFIHSIGDSVINIYSLLLKKDQAYPKMIKISNDNEINDSLRCATSNNDKDYKLGQIVWGRLANELFGINKIFFSPTWAFLAIPIEYFPVNEKHYFNDIYNMYRLSSTRELVEREIDDDHFSNAYLYGGLSYEDTNDGRKANIRSGFEPLFNTKIEIDEISTILKKNGVNTVELTGNNGTEQSIKDLSNTDVEILHIATHGDYRDKETEIVNSYGSSMIYQYSPNEDVHANSFLVMSGANRHLNNGEPLNYEEDGLLTANEISKLDLHKIKILVLSACETGRGNYGTDDMMWGVQRGFKEAGVKSILMSLRKVDDEATRILMVEFYKNLMSGKTKLQSLNDAQKYLRQVYNGKYDKPKYWASFILLDGLN